MTDIQHIYETIECNGFADSTLHLIDNYINDIQNGARQVRLSLGRPSSRATRQQALEQVAMLQAAKESEK